MTLYECAECDYATSSRANAFAHEADYRHAMVVTHRPDQPDLFGPP